MTCVSIRATPSLPPPGIAKSQRQHRQSLDGMSEIRFESVLHKIGRWTIVRLPDEASAKLPSRGQVAVKGVLNHHAFRAVLEPDGRRGHWLKIDKTLQHAVAAHDGDRVVLEVEPIENWPEPAIPKDFRAALDGASDTSSLWRDITPMARWEWVRWINATKNPDTRKRRIDVSISKLRAGKRRPCCFDLAACTDPYLAKNGRLVDAKDSV